MYFGMLDDYEESEQTLTDTHYCRLHAEARECACSCQQKLITVDLHIERHHLGIAGAGQGV